MCCRLYVLHAFVCASLTACIHVSTISPLQYLLMDFCQTLSLVHLGTKMNWLGFGVKRSFVKITSVEESTTWRCRQIQVSSLFLHVCKFICHILLIKYLVSFICITRKLHCPTYLVRVMCWMQQLKLVKKPGDADLDAEESLQQQESGL